MTFLLHIVSIHYAVIILSFDISEQLQASLNKPTIKHMKRLLQVRLQVLMAASMKMMAFLGCSAM
jgi:hypothetical protein